jgi:hypothetical protein
VPLRYHHHRVRDDHSWVQPSRFLTNNVRSTLEEQNLLSPRPDSLSFEALAPIEAPALVQGRLSKLW